MSARVVGALARASWHQAKSYRLSLVMQTGGLLFMVVPLFFISTALQSTMAGTIAAESDQYFSFLLVGSAIWAAGLAPADMGSDAIFPSFVVNHLPAGLALCRRQRRRIDWLH